MLPLIDRDGGKQHSPQQRKHTAPAPLRAPWDNQVTPKHGWLIATDMCTNARNGCYRAAAIFIEPLQYCQSLARRSRHRTIRPRFGGTLGGAWENAIPISGWLRWGGETQSLPYGRVYRKHAPTTIRTSLGCCWGLRRGRYAGELSERKIRRFQTGQNIKEITTLGVASDVSGMILALVAWRDGG